MKSARGAGLENLSLLFHGYLHFFGNASKPCNKLEIVKSGPRQKRAPDANRRALTLIHVRRQFKHHYRRLPFTVLSLKFTRRNSKMEPMQFSIRKERLGLQKIFWRPCCRNLSILKSWSCSSWFNDLSQIIQKFLFLDLMISLILIQWSLSNNPEIFILIAPVSMK